MKMNHLLRSVGILYLLVFSLSAFGQIVVLDPANPQASDSVTIIYDATQGTGGLVGASSVYMHSGVVTSGQTGTAWTNVIGNWGQDDGVGRMTRVQGETNKWQITLSPSIREYYRVPENTTIFRLAMVFRNANGSVEGKGTPGTFPGGFVAQNQDIYLDINPGVFVRISSPTASPVFVEENGQVNFSATASVAASSFALSLNTGSGFQEVTSVQNATTVSHPFSATETSVIQVKATAVINGETYEDNATFNVVVRKPNQVAPLPTGTKRGINYGDDPTKVTLSLLAPLKEFVFVVGDFTNWQLLPEYQMKRDPDGENYWLEVTGLEPGKEYVYQYWVDGTITIGDPYADKIVDPWNDRFIPESVYPNLIPYDKTQYGPASVLQTNQTPYVWRSQGVAGGMPRHDELIIYELLVRDFIGSHNYKDLADTLSYLKRLGVNAIELMPIMEFEGNESWGYNPMYFFAPDKYYGTRNDLKAFIDKCHEEGFVVLLDMVLNHAFGLNPKVRMYWDAANNRPAANSPWFNQEATHPFNVGFDFNHESQYTKDFVDDVNRYWLEEYRFDGYRFDLSKGFTQRNNPNDVGAWSAYDDSRIAILKRMADKIWEFRSDAVVILEHFADNREERELAEYGMLLWGNMTPAYGAAVRGDENASFNGVLSSARGWEKRGLVSYMESHDEERLMVKARTQGAVQGAYNIRDVSIALDRVKLATAFFYTTPGPKMLWQFGELGYDFSINACPPDGLTISEDCRTANKPIPWGEPWNLDYHLDPERSKLYKTTAAIIDLVRSHRAFQDGNFSWTPSGKMRRINITHPDLDVTIIGNFGLTPGTVAPNFSKTGDWYSYFGNDTLSVSNVTAEIELAPGEFRIYTDRKLAGQEPGLVIPFRPIVTTDPDIILASQPVKIIFDATAADPAGTAGLVGADVVYMYAGVVVSGPTGTQWEFIRGTPDQDDQIGKMTKVPGQDNLWEITITPRTYFNVPEGQVIYRIGMFFRNANGTNKGTARGGSDIFLSVTPEGSIVTTTPEVFTIADEVRIVFDARIADPAGTPGLRGASRVYMHSGVVTGGPTSTTWSLVRGNWGQDDGIGQMSRVAGETDQWEITIVPRQYYNVPAGTTVYRLGMVFRNANGTAEGKGRGGSDIFIDVAQPTGFSGQDVSHTTTLYPNPATHSVSLSMENAMRGMVQVQITDLRGSLVEVHLFEKHTEYMEYAISLDRLTPGLYLMNIQQGNQRAVKKLSVSK